MGWFWCRKKLLNSRKGVQRFQKAENVGVSFQGQTSIQEKSERKTRNQKRKRGINVLRRTDITQREEGY